MQVDQFDGYNLIIINICVCLRVGCVYMVNNIRFYSKWMYRLEGVRFAPTLYLFVMICVADLVMKYHATIYYNVTLNEYSYLYVFGRCEY